MSFNNKVLTSNNFFRFNNPVFILIFAVFTSGHNVLVDVLGVRLILQLVMIGLALNYLLTSFNKRFSTSGFIIIFVTLSSLIGELMVRQDIYDILGYVLLIALTFVVLLMHEKSILKFIVTLNHLNWFFATSSIIALIISINSSIMFEALFEKAPYYSNSFLSGLSWQSLMSHADTYQVMFGIKFPRITAYLQQASLVPSYFLLPLSIYFAFIAKNKMYIGVTIILFALVTLGGNIYVAIAMSVLIYFCSKYVPYSFFTVMPFILLLLTSVLLAYFFIDSYDPNTLKQSARSFSATPPTIEGFTESPLIQRLGSAVVRLALMGYQVIGFADSFPLPAVSEITTMTIGGNVIGNGLRGGVVGLIFTCIMYYTLFKSIASCLKQTKSNHRVKRVGFSLMYALIFQSFLYNDFGFSTYFGYIMFAVIIRLTHSYLQLHQLSKI
jgi:hypothetical protein